LVLVFSGHSDIVLSNLPVWIVMLLLTLLALPLTAGAPTALQQVMATNSTRARWRLQVAVLLLVIAFIASLAAIYFRLIQAPIPLLTPLTSWLLGSMEPLGHTPTIGDLAIPLLYFALPVAVLLPLGMRWRDMGFGRGYRSWAVIALFSAPLLVLIGLELVSGQKSALVLLFLLIQNSLRNGFFEEFLFRGPLLNRLNLLCGPAWGVALSTLIFALFHAPTYTVSFGGDALVGLAYSLVNPVVFGLCFAVIVLRTRNLLASSVIHALFDTASIFVFG
jgi:membrane protease YdiL (CAAX protease family)